MTDLAGAMFSTPEMTSIFSSESHVRQMLRFEAALAHAEARAGVIPSDAADAIARACRVDRFDLPALYREAALAGTLAIPLARTLATLVGGEAAKFVHWGATSQDAIDTATVLQMRDALDLLDARLLEVGEACSSLAERYRLTPMAGRTLLQQALPITFGLKAARWLAMVTRRVNVLRDLRQQALVVQLGGAAGTLASLGEKGPRVVQLLAEELDLGVPELPWHTERDRVADVTAALGVLAGAMAKIAGDVALLAQTEVGEAAEASVPGKGGSSTLPQKRNPIDSTMAISSARLAMASVPVVLAGMAQEHERAAGGWQAEWSAIPDLFRFVAGAVERVRSALEGLDVDQDRMRTNLELTSGLIMAESLSMALAANVGRHEAHEIVQAACSRARTAGVELRDVALGDSRVREALSAEAIERAMDPSNYLGSTDELIGRALDGFRQIRSSSRAH